MAAKWKMLFRLLKIYGKLDLLWFLRDTKYCLLQMSGDFISAMAAITGVFLLTARFGGFGGMKKEEILFMLGYATLVDGLYLLFYASSNMGQISRVIGRGQLDHNMLEPVPMWMQMITEGFSPVSGNSKLICGTILTAYALNGFEIKISFLWLIGLIFSVICSCIIMISVINSISCLAFYAPVAAEEIAMVVLDLFQSLKVYPFGGLPRFWRLFFCSVIPVGLGAWLPSRGLFDVLFLDNIRGIICLGLHGMLTVVLLLIMISLFKKGMKHYAKYGSPRYSGFGHR